MCAMHFSIVFLDRFVIGTGSFVTPWWSSVIPNTNSCRVRLNGKEVDIADTSSAMYCKHDAPVSFGDMYFVTLTILKQFEVYF